MKTILVVDSVSAVQQFVRETLESKGYKTLGATDTHKAYEILTNHISRVDLVLTEYNMPMGTGLELVKRIRRNPELERMPAIILSDEVTPQSAREEHLDIGLTTWIMKPYRPEFLLREIERSIKENGF